MIVRLIVGLGIVHLLWFYFFLIGRLALLAQTRGAGSRASEERAVEVSISTGVGVALFLFTLFVLAASGFLTELGVFLDALMLLVLLTLLQAQRLRSPVALLRDICSPLRGCIDIAWVLSYVFSLPTVTVALLPPTLFDSTMYHLAHAVDWARAGHLTVDQFLRFPLFAYNFELLYAAFFVCHLDEYVQLATWISFAWCTTGTYALARLVLIRSGVPSISSSFGAAAAAACFAAFPVALQFAEACYIDIPAGFMLIAATSAFIRGVREPARYSLAIAITGGSFVGFKLALAAYGPLIILWLVVANWKQAGRRRPFWLYLLTFAAIASPWYLRNFLIAGDPLSPTLNMLFNRSDPYWSRADYQAVLTHIRQPGFVNALLRPALLFSQDAPAFSVLLLYVPILALGVDIVRRRAKPAFEDHDSLNFATTYAVFIAIVTSTMYGRYLLQFYGVFLAALVVTIFRFSNWIFLSIGRSNQSSPSHVAAIGFASALVFPAPGSGVIFATIAYEESLVPQGVADPQKYLSANRGYTEVSDVIDILRAARSGGRVLAFQFENTAYYFRREGVVSVGDFFGPGRYADLKSAIASNALGGYLRNFNIVAVVRRSVGNQVLKPRELELFHRELGNAGFVDYSNPHPDGAEEFVRSDVLKSAEMAGYAPAYPHVGSAGNVESTVPVPQGVVDYPNGVLVDSASLASTRGIYTGDHWMSADVRFCTHADRGARSIQLVVYVPAFAPWTTSPGEIESLDRAGKIIATTALKPGQQTVVLPVAKGAVTPDGVATVTLHLTGARVPKDLGLNGDTRNLSAILISASTI